MQNAIWMQQDRKVRVSIVNGVKGLWVCRVLRTSES